MTYDFTKYESLKETSLPELPAKIDSFIETFIENYEENVGSSSDLNRYHLYNEIYQQIKLEKAVNYFQENLRELNFPKKKIEAIYNRISVNASDNWVSNKETATSEIEEFINLVNLLKEE